MATKRADTQADRASLSVEGRSFELTQSVSFEAAHYMPGKPEGHPYRGIHGHSFRLEATISGAVQEGEQWVEDFAVVKAALQATAAKLDHSLLNEIEGLGVPTLERICIWVAADLATALPGLTRVTIARPSLDESCTLVL